MRVCVFGCVYVYMCVCVCIHICVYVCLCAAPDAGVVGQHESAHTVAGWHVRRFLGEGNLREEVHGIGIIRN